MTQKVHDYIFGNTFGVITESSPLMCTRTQMTVAVYHKRKARNPTESSLMYILTTAELVATGQCWIASLSDYIFTIKYINCSKNADVGDLKMSTFPDIIKAVSLSGNVDFLLIDSFFITDASNITIKYRSFNSSETFNRKKADFLLSLLIADM